MPRSLTLTTFCLGLPVLMAPSCRGVAPSADSAAGDLAPAADRAATDSAATEGGAVADLPTGDGLISPALAVDRARYLTDLTLIAAPRPPGSTHWQKVQDLCHDRLEALGFTVTRETYATGVNVVGRLAGTREPKKQVVLSAHYDHIKNCSGADDNGTGVAGLLEAARVLAAQKPERTLVAACWDEEEKGLLGSQAYAKAARARGDDIVTSIVFEMIGYKDTKPGSQQLPAGLDLLFPVQAARVKARGSKGDFITVIYDDHAAGANTTAVAELERAARALGLEMVTLKVDASLATNPLIHQLIRSDHASFWLSAYPAVMLTDTANYRNPYYHCAKGDDAVSTLDHDFAVQIIRAVVSAVALMLRT